MWLATRLEYWMSFCRLSTSQIVSGSVAHRIPQMHGEDQRVLARIVVEDRLGRRVGEDAAVPVELAVDAHRRERRRQRAGRHDVLDADLAMSRLSKYFIWLVRTCAAPTVSRGLHLLTSEKSTSSSSVFSSGAVE